MNLALFDLDHTLIPFDSNTAWMDFLVRAGAADAESTAASNRAFARDYMAGTFDPLAYHRFTAGLLAPHPRRVLEQWRAAFGVEIETRARELAPGRELVDAHRRAGDLCCIVTTTNRFVAEVFAAIFGVDHLVATEAATQDGSVDAMFTGEVEGDPCFGACKVEYVKRWLEGVGYSRSHFERTFVYSDSRNDLPLLQWADEAIAVNPDPVLRAEAKARGWRIVDLRSALAG